MYCSYWRGDGVLGNGEKLGLLCWAAVRWRSSVAASLDTRFLDAFGFHFLDCGCDDRRACRAASGALFLGSRLVVIECGAVWICTLKTASLTVWMACREAMVQAISLASTCDE